MISLKLILMVLVMSIIQQQIKENVLINASLMKTENRWRIVNDGVMGGLSSSNAIVKNDKIIFAGNISLLNNGGFASLRSPVNDYNFERFSGIELRIKADGKLFSVSMKETSYFTGYFYTASFETKKDEWQIIKIPFKIFKLYYYGKETGSDKKIPLKDLKEISLLIGDKQNGSFKVEIDYIGLYL